MANAFFFFVFVALVNGGCIFSFNRAQRALRDLGAAWVRALSTARPQEKTSDEEQPPRPSLRIRVPTFVSLPQRSLTLLRHPARG